MSVAVSHELILVVDYGSQYTQLIARRLRKIGVFSEVIQPGRLGSYSGDARVRGLVLSGGPGSATGANVELGAIERYVGRMPILGICYGAQLLARVYGGAVTSGEIREYGSVRLQNVASDSLLFAGVEGDSRVWMSHGDTIVSLPAGWRVLASTDQVGIVAFSGVGEGKEGLYGVQFHPEVSQSACGMTLLRNFVVAACGCSCEWNARSFVASTQEWIRSQVGDAGVVLGLSGGVDSSVTALLLHRVLGDQLSSIFVDHGLLREGEYESVLGVYRSLGLKVVGVEAGARFLAELAGVTDPETKRKTIGRCFIEEFERAASSLPGVAWLAQGTIYPDVIESGVAGGVTIKSHHNVGGLPERMRLRVLEPLRYLFKDEVRVVGRELGLPESLLGRHPFPGPGLAIRIVGEVTAERVRVLQRADAIFREELRAAGMYDAVWQAGAILLPIRTVGVMGDERTYESVVALRAVDSIDGMTADWHRLPYDLLERISNRIIREVQGVNRVVYDISSKPPATIEWE